MKKILVLTLSLIFVMALAVTATAGIRNTVHDFQSGGALSGFGSGSGSADATSRRGMCSYCHIPHSSKGDRLWPATGDANVTNRTGVVGVLCASCHNGLTNANNTRSPMGGRNGVDRSSDIYNTLLINHVLIDDGVYANNTNQNYVGGATQYGQSNTWPYCATQGVPAGTAQQIECSSCHNPHSEQFGQSTQTTETSGYLLYGNDFLRANFYNTSAGVAFCEYCHEEKTRNVSPANNTIMSGTHPVGTTANAAGAAKADIHIESAERVGLRGATGGNVVSSIQYDMGLGTGAGPIAPLLSDNGIGNHLTAYGTGGVTCQTCHKVHGAQRGTGNAWTRRYEFSDGATVGSYNGSASQVYLAASDDGNCNILAVENDANGGTAGYSYPTEGRTDGDYNDLCVDCHETTPSLGPNWVASNDVASNTSADAAVGANRIPNDAHPINIAPDGLSETGFRLTVQDPSGWSTSARWAGTTNTRRNHSFVNGGRWAGVGIATPANRSEIICMTCHSLHDGIKGTPILRDSSATYCVDCHTQSVGAVSHPVGYGSAMRDNPENVNWPNGDNLPLADYYTGGTTRSYTHSNGNTVEDMECYTCHAAHDGVDNFMLRVKDDNSRICVGCHTDFVAQGQENPGNYISEYNEAASNRLGSHYTGTVVDSNGTIGETRWTYSGAWTDTDQGAPTSYKRQTSHWYFSSNGGTNAGSSPLRTGLRMQCQSCHTPHNAASGLEEPNVYDGTVAPVDFNFPGTTGDPAHNINFNGNAGEKMAFTPTSALLLGNNGNSKMCATCHWPTGTHVTTIYTVPAKPDPMRAGAGAVKKRYRDFTTRTGKFIISVLRGEQETQYNVYDLIADGSLYDPAFTYDGNTPESPCNFPPLLPGRVPTSATGVMVCDSCHTPHGAVTGAGAFILEGGTGSAGAIGVANQRVATRNYQALCWLCHDK